MEMLNLIWFSIGLVVWSIGLVSKIIKSRWMVSVPMLATLFGIAIGPAALNWIDPTQWEDYHKIVEETARLTLAIALISVALRIPPDYLKRYPAAVMGVLLLTMPLMFAASGLLAYVLVDLPLLTAFLLGAAVTPTDPVVASAIVTGPLAEEKIPGDLRHFISSEAGANDGLAYPFVMLPLLLQQHPAGEALGQWLLHTILWEVGAAALLGLVVGYAAAKAMSWAEKSRTMEKVYFLGYSVAVSLIALAGGKLIGSDGIFAVFVAGMTMSYFIPAGERADEAQVQEAVNHFFTLPVFMLLGAVLPWDRWVELGWPGIVLCAAVLAFRRPPFLLLLKPLFRPLTNFRYAAFDGWFGPIGVAALFYVAFAHGKTGSEDLWNLGTLIIFASIVVHGITATPLTRRF